MKIEGAFKTIQWGYGEGATKIPLYLVAVPAEKLAEKAVIFRRTPQRRTGYQRGLRGTRLGRSKSGVVGYILDQMGIFPTSILVNIRKEEGTVQFEKKNANGENIEVGNLVLPDDVTWYVVDGQHRLEGLKIAMRERKGLQKYPVIVSMTNEDIFYEMLIFYLVNSRAKSVKTGLAYRILQRMLYDVNAPKWIDQTIMTGADRRKAIAAMIVDYLNQKTRSPFYEKIKEIGEARKPEHLTEDQTLTRYVTLVLSERVFSEMYDEDIADILIEYWRAIKSIYPKCFQDPSNYFLLRTIGLSSLMRLFPAIYAYSVREGDVSEGTMEKYLRYLLETTPEHRDVDFRSSIDESWWHGIDGPGIIHGTGEGHYQEVARKFGEKIALVRKKERGQ
ncbi:DGQHR domain-containing protein [Candidatus Bathyarchaeota archaeon]|nr:DGQHR domain-containing protein [Candidatus Bathyarchaeota archaeon]